MRTIWLKDQKPVSTRDLIRQVMESSPHRGLNVDQIRKRVRVLDALEKAVDELHLEDADHATLCEAVNSFPFIVANANLLQILDSILGAKDAKQISEASPNNGSGGTQPGVRQEDGNPTERSEGIQQSRR